MPTITGTDGDDNLVGTGGPDLFYPLLGNDTVNGLGDSDTLIVDYSHAPIDPYGGGSAAAPYLSTISSNGGSFSGTIVGGAAVHFSNIEHLHITLNFWQDKIVIDAAALAFGATLWLDGGRGNDSLQIDLSAYASVTTQVDAGGLTGGFGTFLNFENFAMDLTEGADSVTTGSGNDTLTGNGGNDILNSGAGDDILSGGAGSNILTAGAGDDQITSVGIDTVDGGTGFDSWSGNYGWLTADFSITRDQTAGTATLSVGTTLTGIERIESLVTGSGNDVFVFASQGEGMSIDAGAGRDSLTLSGNGFSSEVEADGTGAFKGLLGNDRFTGIEILNFTGLANADTMSVDAAPLLSGAILRLDAAGGSDTLIIELTALASISFVIAANGTLTTNVPATFLNFENYQLSTGGNADNIVTGAGNDVIHGNAGNDVISTGGGNDLLDGGAGADSLTGGTGNDIYIVADTNDTIVENAGEGRDEIRTGLASFTLAALTTIEDLTGTSNAGQTLTGNALANVIIGGAGNDYLIGLGGNDLLQGMGGNDTYLVEGGTAAIIEYEGSGSDIVYATESLVLGDSAEVETFAVFDVNSTNVVDFTGNNYAQLIVGNAGANVLTGGGGADILDGKGGADTFRYVSAVDSTVAAMDRIRGFQTGLDKIDLSAAAATGVGWVQQTDPTDHSVYQLVTVAFGGGSNMPLRVDGALAMSDFVLVITNLNLVGTAADGDSLAGGNGNDTLDGLGGADTMVGRAGNDIYYVDHANDVVVEVWDQGNDTVYARASYALAAGASVEILSAASRDATTPLMLTGNDFDQTIIGNAGVDILIGGGGNDRLVGGAGNDRLEGGVGADSFVFEAAADSRVFAMRSDGHKFMPDIIIDFTRGTDKIDLGAIDAIPNTQPNDAFTFIGSGAFTHHAGQVRFETAGGSTFVYADIDGDGHADLQIALLTPVALTAGDFIL